MKFRYIEIFFSEISIFTYILLKIVYFEFCDDYYYCDVVLGMLVPILVCMERRDPLLYYGSN